MGIGDWGLDWGLTIIAIPTYANSLLKNPINPSFAEKLRKIWTQNTEGAGVFWLENVILSVLSMSSWSSLCLGLGNQSFIDSRLTKFKL